MADVYRLTPPPRAGQQGPPWLRWVDRYAHTHAAAVETIAVADFPPMVQERITTEDGETATDTNFQLVCTLMARLGAARGLQTVPITLEDAVAMTEALALEKALLTLRASAVIGDYRVETPAPGPAPACPLGTALQHWLEAVLSTHPPAPPVTS